jgi:hypothetical protein
VKNETRETRETSGDAQPPQPRHRSRRRLDGVEAAARRLSHRPPPFQPGRGTGVKLPGSSGEASRDGAQHPQPARSTARAPREHTGAVQAAAGARAQGVGASAAGLPHPGAGLLGLPAADIGSAKHLVEQLATRLDELCYVWESIRELDRVRLPGELTLRARAAELMLTAAGGEVHLPMGGLLSAARAFLRERGTHEAIIERLHAWYCPPDDAR